MKYSKNPFLKSVIAEHIKSVGGNYCFRKNILFDKHTKYALYWSQPTIGN